MYRRGCAVKLNVRKMTALAVSVSLAMVLSFIESQIPPLVAVPGVKIGLSNIVSVFLLYTLGAPSAVSVSLIRVFLSALLFGNSVSLIYSFSGAALSLLFMILAKKIKIFSHVGVSIIGGVFHNIGQTLAAMAVMENAALAVYIPPLLISGLAAGIIVGVAAGILAARLEKHIN